jgi:hypothetical protein
MKINATTTQLAFLMLMLHIITRGATTGLDIIGFKTSTQINYGLMFVAEITYIIVILYLISVLFLVKNKPTAIAMIAFLTIGIINFILPIAYKSELLTPDNVYILAIPGILTLAIVILMLATSFRIDPPALGLSYQVFFGAVIIVAALRIALPYILVSTGSYNPKINPYLNIISLIPAFTIFFIIQKVALLLNTGKQ